MEPLSISAVGGLFPRGITPYLLGGVLIGIGVSVIYLGTGIIAGASTFFEAGLSYVSDVSRFNKPRYRTSRGWRVVFTAGIISGGALYGLVLDPGIWTTDVQWWRLLAGGFLVGVGTRVGKGCTSGHGVCGIGSRSGTSLVSVVTFLAVAIGTAQVVQAMGVVP